MSGYHTLNPSFIKTVSTRDRHLDAHTRARWTKPDGGEVALDGIATNTPYGYSALDPKSMEERGVEQFRRKPKFQYVRFMIVPSTIM